MTTRELFPGSDRTPDGYDTSIPDEHAFARRLLTDALLPDARTLPPSLLFADVEARRDRRRMPAEKRRARPSSFFSGSRRTSRPATSRSS